MVYPVDVYQFQGQAVHRLNQQHIQLGLRKGMTYIDLLALGTKHLDMETPFESAEALRDHLIELISVRNLRHRPEALFALFRQFLQRLTLPRLCHFLDLVLPQLTPVRCPMG